MTVVRVTQRAFEIKYMLQHSKWRVGNPLDLDPNESQSLNVVHTTPFFKVGSNIWSGVMIL